MTTIGGAGVVSDDVPFVYFSFTLVPSYKYFVPASIAIARRAFIEMSYENFIGTAAAH
jgi:hypothetical protein